MATFRLIVCEKTGHWAAALRSMLPLLTEVRSLTACTEMLAASPLSLVAVEVTPANVEHVREFVLIVAERFPRAAVVVLPTTDALEAEPLFREAGAVDVVVSVLQAPRLARLARRLASRLPDVELELHELIEETLPWPSLATAEWTAAAATTS